MEQIKQQIASGALRPGDQLPTVRQMAVNLGVNFNTVARAYRLLDEAGIISTRHGRGTYILEAIPSEAVAQLRYQALEELTRRYLAQAATKFKTFGCGLALASSSLVTEWVKGRSVEEALQIKNTDVAQELALPPVKIHCSVLAEDAIKAAIADWQRKRGQASGATPAAGQADGPAAAAPGVVKIGL